MYLYILRHGEAQEGEPDALRLLTEVGEQQARSVGRFLKNCGVNFDVVFSSPLIRARQTANLVVEIIQSPEVTITEYLVPGSDHRQLIDQLNNTKAKNVLLVGHEPHLSEFIGQMIGLANYTRLKMMKGSIAKLTVSIPIVRGKAELNLLVNPFQMKII